MEQRRRYFFTDFDGTVAQRDFYRLVLDELELDLDGEPWAEFRAGRTTHFEALRRIFAAIRADDEELDRLLDRMEPDPELAPDLERLARAGWEVHIVSAGSDWYIRRILDRVGARPDIPIHSNPGRFLPGKGLLLERPTDERIQSDTIGIDKAATLRTYAEAGARLVFAGDSTPDLEAARLVRDEDRFARGTLARALDSLGVSYRPFERWHDIVEALLKQS